MLSLLATLLFTSPASLQDRSLFLGSFADCDVELTFGLPDDLSNLRISVLLRRDPATRGGLEIEYVPGGKRRVRLLGHGPAFDGTRELSSASPAQDAPETSSTLRILLKGARCLATLNGETVVDSARCDPSTSSRVNVGAPSSPSIVQISV